MAGGKAEGPMCSRRSTKQRRPKRWRRMKFLAPFLRLSRSPADEAIAVANDTDYGLQRLFSPPIPAAIRAARDIRAGTVTVNCYGEG